jgi:hypothetical protein
MPDAPSSSLPGLERVPGKQNWIENLPAPMRAAWHRSIIYRAAKHIAAKGRPVGMAIAFAKNWAQHICDTGDVKQFPGLQQVGPVSRAEACAAVTLWGSMRAAAKADTSIPASERAAIELAFAEVDRLSRVIELAMPFNEQLHPRGAKGTPGGGKFVKSNSSGKLAKAVRKKLPGKNAKNFEEAVRRYQENHDLQVDGVVGRQTAAALLGHPNASQVQVGRISDHQQQRLLNVLGKRSSSSSSSRNGKRPHILTPRDRRQRRRRASTLARVRDYLTGKGLLDLAVPPASGMREAVKQGHAMPAPGQDRPGRFNIRNRSELADAIRAVGRARPNTEEERAKVRRFCIKRAREMGAMEMIPDNWNADGSLKG